MIDNTGRFENYNLRYGVGSRYGRMPGQYDHHPCSWKQRRSAPWEPNHKDPRWKHVRASIDAFHAEPTNATFLAKVKLSDQKLVVKFVGRYAWKPTNC